MISIHSFSKADLDLSVTDRPSLQKHWTSQRTPYDITQHDTPTQKSPWIYQSKSFFNGCLVLFHPSSWQTSCSVCPSNLHISIFLCLHKVHTHTCLPVIDQGWESIGTSWFNFDSVMKQLQYNGTCAQLILFTLSESCETLNTCLS